MLNILKYIWALPVTAFGLLLMSAFFLFKQVELVGIEDLVVEWRSVQGSWLERKLMDKDDGRTTYWLGFTSGATILYRRGFENEPILRKHEHTHVRQIYRLGIFQPILYGLALVASYLGCPDGKPYADNPFEIEANRVEEE